MPDTTITVKLRDARTAPPSTRTFILPVSRLILTSSYFRQHLDSPLSRHRDGIFRLNFPDFSLFAIYAEWLSSGEIFSKAGLAQLKAGGGGGGDGAVTPREKARKTYEDYLGAWFLGSWVKDMAFKDTLISLMVDKMEDMEGYPEEFVRALSPSLVDIVFTGSKEGDPIRMFLFAAVQRYGTEEDVRRFVPDEGEQWPRAFVRGLLVYLHESGGKRDREEEENVGTVNSAAGPMETQSTGIFITEEDSQCTFTATTATSTSLAGSDLTPTATTTTTTSLAPQYAPSAFMRPMENVWTPVSHVSWPSTVHASASTSKVSSSGYISQTSGCSLTSISEVSSSGPRKRDRYIGWPRSVEEQCMFHEHTLRRGPCWRSYVYEDRELEGQG